MNRVALPLRILWLFVTLGVWAIVLYLFTLKSAHPDVFGLYSWHYFAVLLVGLLIAALVTEGNFHPGLKILQPIRGRLLALTLSTLLTLAAVEVLLRIIDPLGLSYFSESTRHMLDRLPDPDLKYKHRPNFAATYQGVELRFNELGLRDDPIGPKPPGEFRILALGDSQTMGWGVARDKIWTVRLQKILTERLHRPVRVINTGVVSYETRQEYRFLMRNGYATDPDMLLLMYMDNDIEIDDRPYDPWTEYSLKGKPPLVFFDLLLRKLRIFQLIYYWKLVGIHAPGYDPRQVAIPYDFQPWMREQSGWKASMFYLEKIARSAEEHKIPFVLFHFDWVSFAYSRELDKDVRAAVSPWPAAYVPDWFAGKDVRLYINSKTDSHPNAEGHRIQAEHIAQFILDQHWIPPGPGGPTAAQ